MNRSCLFLVIFLFSTCFLVEAQNSKCLDQRLKDVKSRRVPLRGGNLGSWFIQEGWMVSWLWDNNGCNQGTYPGSYLLEQCLGSRAQSVMQKHWSTFVTEDDFRIMSQNNLNAVRLPIGWWQIYDTYGGAANAPLKQYVDPKNYQTGALAYIDKAFEWGSKWGIGILLDMHAPCGSQNGNDHSAPSNPGNIYFDKYPANPAQTADSIELYTQRYANKTSFLGFCLLNEPGNTASKNGQINSDILRRYYQTAYTRVRKYSRDALVVINPLINPFESGTEDYWKNFMNPPQYNNVLMSLHFYHIWGFEGKSDDWKINYINNDRVGQIRWYNQVNPKPMLIDEWSNSGISDGGRAMRAQLNAWRGATGGWVMWAWSKTNGGNSWSLRAAFDNGWVTRDQTGVPNC
eukprot:TRINITY_DN4455_c0_g1_i1.p1 TRINITY_DN4455_c0_g1~~TRINITY_DN4455_c0_g1_i1.p1  ORF type:complete len:402 (-),score=114.01 TRINITY_DN4455_c0_g1_i1:88-1293(-)